MKILVESLLAEKLELLRAMKVKSKDLLDFFIIFPIYMMKLLLKSFWMQDGMFYL